VTRGVVLHRLGPPPPVRFFTPAEEAVARPSWTGSWPRTTTQGSRCSSRSTPAWPRTRPTAFYAHPWAWNEIGFGGPAYPRGYKNIDLNGLEPWEAREARPRDPEAWARRVERARRDHGA
jgi:hypothetical protein